MDCYARLLCICLLLKVLLFFLIALHAMLTPGGNIGASWKAETSENRWCTYVDIYTCTGHPMWFFCSWFGVICCLKGCKLIFSTLIPYHTAEFENIVDHCGRFFTIEIKNMFIFGIVSLCIGQFIMFFRELYRWIFKCAQSYICLHRSVHIQNSHFCFIENICEDSAQPREGSERIEMESSCLLNPGFCEALHIIHNLMIVSIGKFITGEDAITFWIITCVCVCVCVLIWCAFLLFRQYIMAIFISVYKMHM